MTGRWHSVLGQEAVVAYFKVYPRIRVGDEQNHKKQVRAVMSRQRSEPGMSKM
jgi:hypothetical protein